MNDDSLARRIGELARELATEVSAEDTRQHVLKEAVDLIDGCTSGAITEVSGRRRREVTTASTDCTAAQADALQYDLDEGPCLDTSRGGPELVYAGDLGNEPRWPTWGPQVAEELGVKSVLCLQLYTSDRRFGALNLYGRDRYAFSVHDQAEAMAVAAQAAAALSTRQQIETLESAVDGRTVIGQAQGILMERHGIDASRAFGVLRRYSSETNTRLLLVARRLVAERQLPTLPPGHRRAPGGTPAAPGPGEG